MYLNADSVVIDSDEGRFTIEMQLDTEIPGVTDEGMLRVIIHNTDLDAFYDQVKGRIGPYLQEMHAARTAVAAGVSLQAFICSPEDVDESGGYDTSDPKHPDFYSVHVDHYDNRDKTR